MGVDVFSTSELLSLKLIIGLPIIGTRLNFCMMSDNPNVSLGIVDCSIYTRHIALQFDFQKERMDVLACTLREFNYLQTLATTFINPLRQNHFIQENTFNKAPVLRSAIAMITNSAITGSYTEYPFWFKNFDLGQIRQLSGRQPIVDFDAADNCCLYVTTMTAKNFQVDIPSLPIDDFKHDHVLFFDFTSMEDATEMYHYPEIVGETLRLELNFTFILEHVSELFVL